MSSYSFAIEVSFFKVLLYGKGGERVGGSIGDGGRVEVVRGSACSDGTGLAPMRDLYDACSDSTVF